MTTYVPTNKHILLCVFVNLHERVSEHFDASSVVGGCKIFLDDWAISFNQQRRYDDQLTSDDLFKAVIELREILKISVQWMGIPDMFIIRERLGGYTRLVDYDKLWDSCVTEKIRALCDARASGTHPLPYYS